MITLKQELVEDLGTPDGIRKALQTAIELEHATLPPYLYALYSLMPGKNVEIGELIQSIVFEEMTHMTLSCNILNAVGGAPVIDDPNFIPKYPGHLPGGVDASLEVPLAPFSPDLLEKVFMEIEEPEDPLVFKSGIDVVPEKVTIGVFYTRIKQAIETLGESLFAHPSNPQVTGVFARFGVIAVHDVATAKAAIDTIIDQGEGTDQDPMDVVDGVEEPAHYYRFAEIVKGRRLIRTDAPKDAPVEDRYAYAGDPIPYDPAGVQPAVTNPKQDTLPQPPHQPDPRYACRAFNYTYTSMLKALHTTFNGDPTAIEPAIGAMESLKQQAIALMAIPLGDGTNAGPSFEYTPVLSGPVGAAPG